MGGPLQLDSRTKLNASDEPQLDACYNYRTMENSNLPTPHNNFFQFALSHVELLRSLIETQLPVELVAALNLSSLALIKGSFVDPNLREMHSDLLASTRLTGPLGEHDEEVLIYFLFEHKSEAEPLTVLQLLAYIVRIWQQRTREGKPLCAIVPLVIYHGSSRWKTARRISDLVRVPKIFDQYLVQFGFRLVDLCELSDEEVSGEPFLQATLRLLKYSRSQELPKRLRPILELLVSVPQFSSIEVWIQAIGVYIMAVNKTIGASELSAIVQQVFPTQFELGSLADRLLTQGRQEGAQVGRQEGIQTGRQEGVLIGKIQLLEELCGVEQTSGDKLLSLSSDQLELRVAELQTQLRDRRSKE